MKPSFESPHDQTQHFNTFEFHKFTEQKYTKKRTSGVGAVKRRLGELVHIDSASERANKHYISYCWNASLRLLGHQSTDKESKQSEEVPDSRKLGRDIIDKRTENNLEEVSRAADDLFKLLEQHGKLKKELKEPQKAKEFPTDDAFRTILVTQKTIRRQRIEWSDEENKIIRRAVKRGFDNVEIAKILSIRTPRDVYSHIQSLNSQRAKVKLPPLPSRHRPYRKQTTEEILADKAKMKLLRKELLEESESEEEHH